MQNAVPVSRLEVKKILLATDFSAASTAAFHESLYLCKQFGASLYVVNVLEYASGVPPESGGLASFYKEAESSLDVLISTARKCGVSCDGIILIGIAHEAILDTMTSQSCDLIALGTRAIRGFERLIFGSTAEAVIRASSRPVLTVGPQAAGDRAAGSAQRGIAIFATDFHPATTEAIALATLFAGALDLPLHCLHVLPKGLGGSNVKPHVVHVVTDALQHLAGRFKEQLQASVCAVTYGSEVSNAVTDYARNHDARLIVLGVRRASLAASHVPSHIAYRIITEATCPVLTIAFPLNP